MKLLATLLATATFLPITSHAQNSFDIALFGDMPYGTARVAAYERLLTDINNYAPLFSAHIGDTKSGSTRCDDSHYIDTVNYFNNLFRPILYSVGDNEWTDCMRNSNGRFDPIDRLAMIRRTYFGTNLSLGRQAIEVTRQSDSPGYALYRENAMLIAGLALFVTIHMPGSNNNREYKTTQGQPNPFYDNDVEYNARNAANLVWLRSAFQTARNNRLLGLMILTQANMFENFMDTSTGATHSGFSEFVAALRDETKRFDGEVVMVSGDTHYMRMDKPLTETYPACMTAEGDCKPAATPAESPGNRILNFTRVEVPGDGDVHWILGHVRNIRGRVFSFEFKIIPENK